MPSPAPAPRLPLEPGPRPFYRPPPPLGCSGVALVALVTLVAFFLVWVVFTPLLVDQIRGFSITRALGLEARATPVPASVTATPDPASVEPSATPLAVVAPAAPTSVPPTPTPEAEYVAVGNSSGDNVALRAEPRTDAKKLVSLAPRTVLLVIGDDVTTSGKLWRNVRTAQGDPLAGWIMAQYLVASGPP
jgi:hypothetical protein